MKYIRPTAFSPRYQADQTFSQIFQSLPNKEVRVHHVSPIRILSVVRKVGNQGGSLVGNTLCHSGQIFIFVKNDVVLSWQMNN
jgi:hypothetical protein